MSDKVPSQSPPANESMPLQGREALSLYLGKINKNVEAIIVLMADFKKALDAQKTLLSEAQSLETLPPPE